MSLLHNKQTPSYCESNHETRLTNSYHDRSQSKLPPDRPRFPFRNAQFTTNQPRPIQSLIKRKFANVLEELILLILACDQRFLQSIVLHVFIGSSTQLGQLIGLQ